MFGMQFLIVVDDVQKVVTLEILEKNDKFFVMNPVDKTAA